MKKKPTSRSAFFNPRVLTSLLVLLAGVFLAWFAQSAVGRTRHGQASPSGGTWITTGSLNTARSVHTATLLPNGMVLSVGGSGSDFISLASAELYDPASGSWTATGSLNTKRVSHTATLLPNGLVLAAGGVGDWPGTLASAELYDPASATWTATGSLNTTRYWYTATLLRNGKVLAAAGAHVEGCCVVDLTSAELYDSTTGTWTATGNLNTARYGHRATLLPNGKVLVEGGWGTSVFDVLASAELYDPASRTWSATGSLNTARVRHTATLLPNGMVLVAGGMDSNGAPLASAELYDPATGSWIAVGPLNIARGEHTATLLSNGMVLVAGGDQDGCSGAPSAELYDPAIGGWTATGDLNFARNNHTATLLPNGNVLVAGGFNGVFCQPGILSSAELYQSEPGPITLSAAKHKVGGINTVRLTWSGATSTNIDVYRNGVVVATIPNTGSYTDSTGDTGRARYIYRVCEAGGSTCSNDAKVKFQQ